MLGKEIIASDSGDLVRRISGGDAAAEEELIEHYSRRLYFLILRSVDDRSDVDHLFQESFKLVLERIQGGEMREPERLSGFITTVARTLVTDYFRKAGSKAPA